MANINFSPLKKIALILAIILLLIRCSYPLSYSQQISDDDDELSGTIIIWASFSEDFFRDSLSDVYQSALTQYVNKFHNLYPQVKVLIEIKEDQNLAEELTDKVEKGLGPDLIFTESTNNLSLIETGALYSFNRDSMDLSKFRSESLVQVIYEDKLYGVPVGLHTQVLCYNKDKVKDIPETLSELIIQARKGYSVGILSSFYDTLWGIGIFGGQLFDSEGNFIINRNLAWVNWMKWLKNLKNEPNFILNQNSFVLEDAFIDGKLAYYVCWSNKIYLLRESLGSDKLGVALLPSGENNEPSSPLLTISNFLFSSVSSTNQTKIALKLAQFLTNTQQQTELTVKYRFIIPANLEVRIDPRLFPIKAVLQKQSKTSISYSLDQVKKTDLIRKYGEDFYTRIMAGEIQLEQAANEFSEIINQEFSSSSS